LLNFAKYFTLVGASLLFGCAANPGSIDASAQPELSMEEQWTAVDEYETVLPTLVKWADYGSASRVALAIAYERNRLEGTTSAVCEALAESRDFGEMASAGRSREDFQILAGIQERSGPMARERAECDHAQALAPRNGKPAKTARGS
jgi:hypothetical protein